MPAGVTDLPRTHLLLSIAAFLALAAVAAIAGYFVARAVRNWTRRDVTGEAFTLQDLREMRARGEITPREFDAMRAALLGRFAEKPGAPPSGPAAHPSGGGRDKAPGEGRGRASDAREAESPGEADRDDARGDDAGADDPRDNDTAAEDDDGRLDR